MRRSRIAGVLKHQRENCAPLLRCACLAGERIPELMAAQAVRLKLLSGNPRGKFDPGEVRAGRQAVGKALGSGKLAQGEPAGNAAFGGWEIECLRGIRQVRCTRAQCERTVLPGCDVKTPRPIGEYGLREQAVAARKGQQCGAHSRAIAAGHRSGDCRCMCCRYPYTKGQRCNEPHLEFHPGNRLLALFWYQADSSLESILSLQADLAAWIRHCDDVLVLAERFAEDIAGVELVREVGAHQGDFPRSISLEYAYACIQQRVCRCRRARLSVDQRRSAEACRIRGECESELPRQPGLIVEPEVH